MKKCIASAFLAIGILASGAGKATSLTDLWWTPSESGWGANIIQQEDILFITMFVYGQNGQPTWLIASNVAFVSGSTYSGALYTTIGPWLGGAFNPGAVGIRQVGTVTFRQSQYYAGVLSYTVDGVAVTKNIQRLTYRHINLGGSYYGAITRLASSTCSSGASSVIYVRIQNTANVASGGETGTIQVNLSDGSGTTIYINANYRQYGSIFEALGTMSFTGVPGTFTVRIADFAVIDDGITGNIFALGAGSCVLDMRFAAVRPG